MPVISQTATLDELLAKLQRFEAIHTMKATVELRLAVENEDRTRVRELTDAPGFVIARRPSEILTIAQVPVVRTLAFQMASNGETFQMHLPRQKRFFVGNAAEAKRSENRTENIRPKHILEAVMIEPPQPGELAAIENAIEGITPYQVVDLVRAGGDGKAKLTRKFWFSRETLELSHMQILDERGDTATLARYEQWTEQDGIPYAAVVTIIRPDDGYSLRIHIVTPGLNETVADDSFVLQAPEGVTVEHLGESGGEQARAKQAGPEITNP